MSSSRAETSWWRRVDPYVPGWLLATLVVWGVRGFQDGLSRDSALYVYAGQTIADGEAPYVEVFNRAGPLAQLLPGLGVEVGRLLGTGDVIGIRVLFFVLMLATPALTHVLARDVFGSRLAGAAAAATLLAFSGLALSATDGPQSKGPMLLGLLVGLWLLVRRRWLAAGVVTGLATLTWQPVLFVLAATALVTAALSPGDARSRLAGLTRFGVGGLATLAAYTGYARATGSLDAFVEGFWGVNAGFTDQEGLAAEPLGAWGALTGWLGWTTWPLAVGSALAIALGVRALAGPARSADVAALGAATVTALGWSAIAFNGAPDALLLMPLAAAGIGGTAALLAHGARLRPVVVAAVAGWAVVAVVATAQLTWGSRTPVLPRAVSEAEAAFASLPEDATVFAFNAPQPLALAGESSISRYVLFGEGMRRYVSSPTGDGIRDYVRSVAEQEPTLVVTSSRGLPRALRLLADDYREVEGGSGWRAFLRVETEPPRGHAGEPVAARDPGTNDQEP